ncbi:MAG: SusC/RagA family TonB-linked outer membrane protein [Bacteroides sp.]|nr:SusC/RagA family TonB-linked outer membrane protein [Bacteroides sp.]
MKKLISLFFFICFFGEFMYAQQLNIEGWVTDINNEPIIGAAVTVKDTSTGVVTDMDGHYSLTVTAGQKLSVSYLGYLTMEQVVTANRTKYNFILKEDAQALDEVIVVGYGTQKRSELTGSISTVKSDAIQDRSAKSIAEALSGMAAGVMVSKGSGAPGETPDIIIRGAASVNGMSPLYIVDGVKQGTGFEFNMRDVESIEILKDAGSCAIYGAQAAGGVILITTKHGIENSKPEINVNARFGLRNISTDIKLLNRDDYILAKKYQGADILSYEGVSSASQLPDVDWMDVMCDTGIEQEYNISLSGASQKLNYYLSGGYYSEEGVFLDTEAKRFSIRSNLDYKINKHVSIGTSIYGSLRKNNPAKSYSIYTNAIPFRTVPTMTPTDANGEYSKTPSYLNGPNLYGNEMTCHYKDNNYALNILAYLNVNIIKGLDFRINGAGKFTSFSNNAFSEAFDFRAVTEKEWMVAQAGTAQDLVYNATLTYDKTIKDHSSKL